MQLYLALLICSNIGIIEKERGNDYILHVYANHVYIFIYLERDTERERERERGFRVSMGNIGIMENFKLPYYISRV